MRACLAQLPASRPGIAVALALALNWTALLSSAHAALPAGWSDADIGSPAQPGSATATNGVWTVAGGGTDIWGTSDQFNFASRNFTGDGMLETLVMSQQNTDPWAKAGVMFRNDSSPGAIHAAVVATPGNGVSFQWRTATNGSCNYIAVGGVAAPVWLKLVRSGATFSAYYSTDSVNWTQIGSDQTVPLATAALAGLAVTAHNNALLCAATFTTVTISAPVTVWTQRNDNARTGQNTNETLLTLANVNTNTFGRLFTWPVDGNIYAQPLVIPNISVPGKGMRRVVYVATEHDSVYAFDAENIGAANTGALWQVSFINPSAGITTVPSSETSQGNISPEVGITSTPVIDTATGTLYVEARTKEVAGGVTNYVHRLHALDIATGNERTNFNSPVIITATNYPGTGTAGYADNDGAGHVLWNGLREHSRPGLLLLNGVVYIGYASPGDHSPYHGWLFGYDAHTLAQTGVFNSTPNGGLGGIWQAGNGLVADSDGFVYVETGNGPFNVASNNYGDSVLKLSTTNGLALADFFTPYNQAYLESQDLDLGSGGSVVLPDSAGSLAHPHLLLGASKTGDIYLLDRSNLGHFNASGNPQIVQWVTNAVGGMWNTPAYFNGTLYYGGVNDQLKAFSIANGTINPTPQSHGTITFGYPGASPSISASGANDAILWAIQADNANGGQAVLHACNATNLAQELYNSAQAGSRDSAGGRINYTVPTVANGKVYVGTKSALTVYGPCLFSPAPVFAPNGGTFTNSITVNLANNTPGLTVYYTLDGLTPTTNSSRFTAPLLLTNSTTLSALAILPGAVSSSVARTTFFNSLSIGAGTGLLASYYSSHFSTNAFAGSPTLVRTDAVVNFNWGTGSPASNISTDYFTVRWTGMVQPQFAETYTFYTTTDDGARLWVNNQLLIDKWVNQAATEWSGSLALVANRPCLIRLEYYENTGFASAVLSWSSPSTTKAVIPQSQLYPSTNLPPVFFTAGSSFANGIFQAQLSGEAGQSYVFQGSTNLSTWTSLITNTAFYNLLQFQDPGASNFPWRFYRAIQQP